MDGPMSAQMELPGATPAPRLETMNGKRVFTVPAKSVLNLESGFAHKLLCDGPTFSAGSACVYKCVYCYVPAIMRKRLRTTIGDCFRTAAAVLELGVEHTSPSEKTFE